jgi:hypothetical protein
LLASVCRNVCKLGDVLLAESVGAPDDALSDVHRFWKTAVKPLAPVEAGDVLIELKLDV